MLHRGWRMLSMVLLRYHYFLFWQSKKKVTKGKLRAAPASAKVSANCSVVLPVPDDAGFCG